MRSVLLVQAAATLFMTGVIWFVQIVHYPLLARVGTSRFPAYESDHARLTGYVVILPMLVELACASFLLFHPLDPDSRPLLLCGAALVVVIWLSTLLLQVPQHSVLHDGWEVHAHHRLVATNWIRTVSWTIRSVLVLWLLR